MGPIDFDIRVPLSLQLAPLPSWVKLVWQSIKSYQGDGKYCMAGYKKIGERAPLQNGDFMSKSQVVKAVKILLETPFLERNKMGKLVCTNPRKGYNTIVPSGVLQDSPGGTTPFTQGYNTIHRGVLQDSTPSKSQLKANNKTNSKKKKVDKPLTLVEKYGHELHDHPAVKSYTEKFPHLRFKILQAHREQIALKIGDTPEALEAWLIILDRWVSTVGWKPEKIHNLVDAFQQLMQEHERQNQMNDGTTPSTEQSFAGRGANVHGTKTGTSGQMQKGFHGRSQSSARNPKRPGEHSPIDYLIESGWTPEQIASISEGPEVEERRAIGPASHDA